MEVHLEEIEGRDWTSGLGLPSDTMGWILFLLTIALVVALVGAAVTAVRLEHERRSTIDGEPAGSGWRPAIRNARAVRGTDAPSARETGPTGSGAIDGGRDDSPTDHPDDRD
jgi:hypothetical protein